jgi:hypothetical protein
MASSGTALALSIVEFLAICPYVGRGCPCYSDCSRELQRTWKEAIVANLMYFTGGIEEIIEKQ